MPDAFLLEPVSVESQSADQSHAATGRAEKKKQILLIESGR